MMSGHEHFLIAEYAHFFLPNGTSDQSMVHAGAFFNATTIACHMHTASAMARQTSMWMTQPILQKRSLLRYKWELQQLQLAINQLR